MVLPGLCPLLPPSELQAFSWGSYAEMEEMAYCKQLTFTHPTCGHQLGHTPRMHTHSPSCQQATMEKALESSNNGKK